MNARNATTFLKGFLCLMTLALTACSTLPTRADIEVTKSTLFNSSKIYTACNLWARRGHVYAGGYPRGIMIPVGTEIVSVSLESKELKKIFHYDTNRGTIVEEVKRSTADFPARYSDAISFVTKGGGAYEMAFSKRRHPGLTMFNYLNKVLVSEDPNVLIRQYDESIITAIQQGVVVKGMTKQQVLYSVGYPMERYTPDYKMSNVWVYYPQSRVRGGSKTVDICFDSKGYTSECMQTAQNENVLMR